MDAGLQKAMKDTGHEFLKITDEVPEAGPVSSEAQVDQSAREVMHLLGWVETRCPI